MAGVKPLAAFEQEFVCARCRRPAGIQVRGGAFRRQSQFSEPFSAALRLASLRPASFLRGYGPRQFEVTVAPTEEVRAADETAIMWDMARAVAYRLGYRAIFAPMLEPQGIGNGTNIHLTCSTPPAHR